MVLVENVSFLGSKNEYASIFAHFVKDAILCDSIKIDRVKDIFRALLDLGGHINKREKRQPIYENECKSLFSPYPNTDMYIKGADVGYIINIEYVVNCLNVIITKNEEHFYPDDISKRRPYVEQRERLYSLIDFYNKICDTSNELKKVPVLSRSSGL